MERCFISFCQVMQGLGTALANMLQFILEALLTIAILAIVATVAFCVLFSYLMIKIVTLGGCSRERRATSWTVSRCNNIITFDCKRGQEGPTRAYLDTLK